MASRRSFLALTAGYAAGCVTPIERGVTPTPGTESATYSDFEDNPSSYVWQDEKNRLRLEDVEVTVPEDKALSEEEKNAVSAYADDSDMELYLANESSYEGSRELCFEENGLRVADTQHIRDAAGEQVVHDHCTVTMDALFGRLLDVPAQNDYFFLVEDANYQRP